MTDFGRFKPYCETLFLIDRDGEREALGFIQPENVKNPERALEALPGGVVDKRRYILIVGAESLAGVSRLRRGNQVFELLRWENICGSHCEALLKLKAGGADA